MFESSRSGRRFGRWTSSHARALAVAVFLFNGAAHADESGTSGPVSAEDLFREGREALKAGDLALACSRFEESGRKEPAKGTLLNLALCLEQSGRLLDARARFQELLELADLDEARRELASGKLRAVEARIPHLVIRLESSALLGTSLVLDGRELSVPPPTAPIALDPGRHVLRVVRHGTETRDIPLDLREGTDLLLTELPAPAATAPGMWSPPPQTPSASPSPPPPAQPPPAVRSTTPAAYITGGLGLLGLAAGAVTGILVIDRARTVDAHCERKLCDQEGLSAGESGRVLSTVSTVSFAVGTALSAVGLYLFFHEPGPSSGSARGSAAVPRIVGAGVGGAF